MPSVVHDTTRYANNRVEVSHQAPRRRERHMRRFKSVAHAQRFLAVHDVVRNLFTIGRHGFAPAISDFCARAHLGDLVCTSTVTFSYAFADDNIVDARGGPHLSLRRCATATIINQ
jgi:hypothetical protein